VFAKKKVRLKAKGVWCFGLIIIILLSYNRPSLSNDTDSAKIPPEKLAAFGKTLIFGTMTPLKTLELRKNSVGKAQCPLCHMFFGEQKASRCPNLVGIEMQSHLRPKEERYRMFSERYAQKGEPNTGIKPHATSGGEYLIESLYCPNCYVREGFGIKGTKDMESGMPIIDQPPIRLTDFEIVAVIAYLQAADTLNDFSKVTAQEDWEHYFNKKLPISEKFASFDPPSNSDIVDQPQVFPDDTPEQIIKKMRCNACHTISTIKNAWGYDGPVLALKANARKRLESAEYQRAKKAGTAHATTPREYVKESILNPDAFIVPGYPNVMLKDFGDRLTPASLEKLVDFLLTLDEPLDSEQ